MREVIKKVYKFDELSSEAQGKVIQDYIEGINWDVESEYILEDFKDSLRELGYPDEDVQFSLSHNQGDGVAFYGLVDVSHVAKRLLTESDYKFLMDVRDEINLQYAIVRNQYGYHYSHYNTMDIEMELESYSDRIDFDDYEDDDVEEELSSKIEEIAYELKELIKDDIKDVSKELEKYGYDYIDDVTNEDNVKQHLLSEYGDFEYYENGKLFVG